MTEYKFYYFDSRGLGEVSRLTLALHGEKFEDIRWTREDWPKYKPSAPFGQGPWLEVTKDGKTTKIGQSAAIACYLAREFGYFGKTNLEAAVIDQVINIFKDLTQVWFKTFYETDETKKAEMLKKLKEEDFPVFFGHYDKLLKANGSNGHFVGNSITLADIYLFDMLFQLKKNADYDPTIQYPDLAKVQQKVAADPKIKKYVAERKETQM